LARRSKRTVIERKKGEGRYVRRNKEAQLVSDRKRDAKAKVKKGQGDRGNVKK
jgi:hypothetical protein